MHCAQIGERFVGAGGYVATGCGLEQSYTCWTNVVVVTSGGYGYGRWGGYGGRTHSQSAVTCAPDGEPHAVASGETGQRGVPLR